LLKLLQRLKVLIYKEVLREIIRIFISGLNLAGLVEFNKVLKFKYY
jgi:hypothetical protein